MTSITAAALVATFAGVGAGVSQNVNADDAGGSGTSVTINGTATNGGSTTTDPNDAVDVNAARKDLDNLPDTLPAGANKSLQYNKLDDIYQTAMQKKASKAFSHSDSKSKTEFLRALLHAKDVNETVNATQADVDSATDGLTKANDGLTGNSWKPADQSGLTAAIKNAETVKASKAYTQDSKNNQTNFDAMIEAGKKINGNEDALASDIQKITDTLNKASKQLQANQEQREQWAAEDQEKVAESYAKTPDKVSYPDQTNPAQKPNNLPETGTDKNESAISAIAAAAAVAMTAVGGTVLKKQRD